MFINPRVDFAFKKLFGSEENKDLLISLINAIVSEPDQVADLYLKNPYNLAEYRQGKMSVLDIKAQNVKGQWYNIEMQITEDCHFDKRALYYWAKLLGEQLDEGSLYKTLQKTISINILDFNYIYGREEFHNCYKILNTETGKSDDLHEMFELHYIELRKFHKDYHQIVSALDRWTTFLTRAHDLSKRQLPHELEDAGIVKALAAVERMFDSEERLVYEVRRQAMMDYESKIDSAIEKGRTEGLEKGIAEGLEKGIAEGLEKGIAKGLEKGIAKGLEKGIEESLARLIANGIAESEARRLLGLL